MPSNTKQTSKPVAKVASKLLKSPTAAKAVKTTAASALAQAPLKKKLK
jgi:hypothetical protein